jgi:hypothetical protein
LDGKGAFINDKQMAEIRRNAERLKAAEWKIYQPDRLIITQYTAGGKQTQSCFPFIDMFIQFAVGLMVNSKKGHLFAKDPVEHPFGYKIVPTPFEWIETFLKTAFTPEGKVDPRLIREWMVYMGRFLKSKKDADLERILEKDQQRIQILEQALAGKSTPPVFKKRPKEDVGEMVLLYTWYLNFSPEDRKQIIRDYFALCAKKKLKAVSKEMSAFERAQMVFVEEYDVFMKTTAPEIAQSAAKQKAEELKARVQEALVQNTLKSLPSEVFEGPLWEEFGDRLIEVFLSMCRAIPAGEFFGGYEILSGKLDIRIDLVRLDVLRSALLQVLCEKVTDLTDEDFIKLFVGKGEGFSHRATQIYGLGADTSKLANKLRILLTRRFTKLPSSVKRKKK